MNFLSLISFSRLNYISNFILLSSREHIVDVDPMLQCKMKVNWGVGYLFGGLRNSSVLNTHSFKIWVEILVYIFISIFSFLLGGTFWEFPNNFTRYKLGRGEIKVMFSLLDWVSLWGCKVWLLFYMVVDNVRPMLIQNTNGNLHLMIPQSLGTVLFFNCFFPENNSNILVTQGGGEGGFILHTFK